MSTMRGTRRFAIVFFVVYVLAVIYPGALLVGGPRPFVLGLPLAMGWSAAWIIAAFFVLLRLDRVYSSAERTHDGAERARDAADHANGSHTAGDPDAARNTDGAEHANGSHTTRPEQQ